MDENPYRSPAHEFKRKSAGGSLRSFRLASDFRYAAEYGPAIWTAIKVQLVCLVLAALTLDLGQTLRATFVAVGVHWAAIAVILYLSPHKASPLRLALIRYGTAVMFTSVILLLPMLFSVFGLTS